MSKVSVIMCTYNTGAYLKNTLESVLGQTYSDIEVLIVDNNSTDDTVSNIKKFNDPRIKLFESDKNLGPYGGNNFLLEKATGKYIAIQDHDDIWHKDKLLKQVQFLEENEEFIGCGTETVMYYEVDKKYFLYYLKEKNFYTVHPSLIFRNIKGIKYDENLVYFGDAFFQKNVLCKGNKLIYNIKEPLTVHIIKSGYGNFTYSRFKFNLKYIRRIIDIHGRSPYSFLVIFYEILKKIVLVIFRFIGNYKLYVWFDRMPYRIMGNKIKDLSEFKDEKIGDMMKSISNSSGV